MLAKHSYFVSWIHNEDFIFDNIDGEMFEMYNKVVIQWRAKTQGNVYPFRNGSQNVRRAFAIFGTNREKASVPKGIFNKAHWKHLFSNTAVKTDSYKVKLNTFWLRDWAVKSNTES